MTAPFPAAGSTPPASLDHARQEIERRVRERLLGRKTDIVTFVKELLAITSQVGQVSCHHAGDHGLRFQFNNEAPFEVELDHNHGKLRMMCAHLAVLAAENEPESAQIFGGEGTIRQTWKARWSNTMHKHDFTIRVER